MWKRSNRQSTPIETSALAEYSEEGSTPERNINLNSGDFSISARPAFGRRESQDILKGLPDLPFKTVPGVTAQNRPFSDVPTTSSVYSDYPSETHNSPMPKLEIPRSSSLYPDDVSPPGSRGANDGSQPGNGSGSPDVSPITDPASTPAESLPIQRAYNSQIPISKKPQVFGGAGSLFSRKVRPPALASPDRDSASTAVTRWDDFSGERAIGEKGKPASTSPDAVRRDVELKYGRRKQSLGNSVEISGPTPRVSSKGPWVPVGWKGAGGRHPIVNPMLDKPLPPGKSPSYPAGSHQRASSQDQRANKDLQRPADNIDPLTRPERRQVSAPLKSDRPRNDIDYHYMTEKDLPKATTVRAPQQPTPPADSPLSRLTPDDTRSPLARNPSNDEVETKRPANPPSFAPPNRRESEDTATPYKAPMTNFQAFDAENQPRSRFSATTYATTVYDSPPATPEMTHDMPEASPVSSILDRKRPVPPAGILSSKVAARKPTPSQLSSMTKSEQENPRFSKTLPKEPPEEKAVSRMETLQAKLDALRRRRGNLQTVIYELTNVVQPSSIAYDMASRQEIKKTVAGFEKELAEVVKEEHETGLKLHRAWKRHDDSTAYEPTHLWVRRVTS